MAQVIFFNSELKQAFDSLAKEDPTKKALNKALEDIEKDSQIGRPMTKDTYKKKGIKRFMEKHSVNNIRIYNLPSAWRLLYSVSSDEIGIIAIILDWINHKDYEKLLK